jgi:hypothetical protein
LAAHSSEASGDNDGDLCTGIDLYDDLPETCLSAFTRAAKKNPKYGYDGNLISWPLAALK